MICPRCKTEMQIQIVSEKQQRSMISILFWLIIALFTCGLALLIPIIQGNKSKSVTYFFCPKCGKKIRKVF